VQFDKHVNKSVGRISLCSGQTAGRFIEVKVGSRLEALALNPSRNPKNGTPSGHCYLQYAASNGTVFAHGEISNEPMNDFEADIYEALIARGLKLVPQVGCSSFRIDFGVCHPSEPGRFVLAIEADGATYHSSCTARDRDRLRQQMLKISVGDCIAFGRRTGSNANMKRSSAR
jgi:hypothetical protein